MSLYQILNQHAKAWWYHKELRTKGQTEEARKRERESIRSNLGILKEALKTPGGHCSIGRGGCSIDAYNHKVQGYDNEYFRAAALAVGLPVIDTTTIPDSLIHQTIHLPMIAVGREPDPAPYHGFSYAPLEYVANEYAKLGATIHNLPGMLPTPPQEINLEV